MLSRQLISNVLVSKCSLWWSFSLAQWCKKLSLLWRCQWKEPSSYILPAGLNSQIKWYSIQTSALNNGKLPSDCSLTPMWHWLQSPHGWGLSCRISAHPEKPAKSACKYFTLKTTSPVAQYCSLSLQGGGAGLQPQSSMAQATEKWVYLTATVAFPEVQNADGKISLADQKGFWSHLCA